MPLAAPLGKFFFQVYLKLRRYFYYLSQDDLLNDFIDPFEDKNRGAVEKQAFYNSQTLDWNIAMVSPRRIGF